MKVTLRCTWLLGAAMTAVLMYASAGAGAHRNKNQEDAGLAPRAQGTGQDTAGSGVTTQSGASIEHVRVHRANQQTQVIVEGKGPFSFVPFRLGDPERLIVDFSGARVRTQKKLIESDLEPVRAVRLSQFTTDIARLEIELNGAAPYSINNNQTELSVVFGASDRAQSPLWRATEEKRDSRAGTFDLVGISTRAWRERAEISRTPAPESATKSASFSGSGLQGSPSEGSSNNVQVGSFPTAVTTQQPGISETSTAPTAESSRSGSYVTQPPSRPASPSDSRKIESASALASNVTQPPSSGITVTTPVTAPPHRTEVPSAPPASAAAIEYSRGSNVSQPASSTGTSTAPPRRAETASASPVDSSRSAPSGPQTVAPSSAATVALRGSKSASVLTGVDSSVTESSDVQGSAFPAARAKQPSGPPTDPVGAAGDDYIIGPQDLVAINIWREPEISRVVPVRPDGKISLPLIGEIRASGLTPRMLQSRITTELTAYLHKPEVTVIIQEANSHKFNIIGEVQRPGSYTLSKTMTVLDAIAAAGGFRDFAKVRKIYVLRAMTNGTRKRIPFDYKEAVKGNNSSQEIELQPGDTVVVP